MKTFNAKEFTPENKRNNCICDSGIPCYYHLEKGVWFNKHTNEEISPIVWSYAIIPVTQTATLENFLLTLIQFGDNTARQDFAQLEPDKQEDAYNELTWMTQTIMDRFNEKTDKA